MHVDDAQDQEELEYYRARDAEENRRTTPPPTAVVDYRTTATVELYGPEDLPGLLTAFRRFGWNTGEDFPLDRMDPERWLRSAREQIYGGSWMNLGILLPVGRGSRERFLGASRRAPLPANVEFAGAALSQLTPSIYALAIWFEWEADVAGQLDKLMRQDRTTERRPLRPSLPLSQGFQVMTPERLKAEGGREWRRGRRTELAAWMDDHFAGFFVRTGAPPDARHWIEIITTGDVLPFSSARIEWMRVLGLDSDWDAWLYHGEETAFRFGHRMSPSDPPHLWVLAGKGGEDRGTMRSTAAIASEFRQVPAALALTACLSWLAKDNAPLLDARPDTTSLDEASTTKLLTYVHQLECHHASAAMFIGAARAWQTDVTRRIVDLALPPAHEHRENDLNEIIGDSLADQAARLAAIYESDTITATAEANLAAAAVNLRLQRNVEWLTKLTVALATITAVFAVIQIAVAVAQA